MHPTTIHTTEGSLSINYIVIDDPCSKTTAKIPSQAPAFECKDHKLQNAVHVNTPIGTKVAIGFAFDTDAAPNYPSIECMKRSNNNYKSGMGMIFRDLLELQ